MIVYLILLLGIGIYARGQVRSSDHRHVVRNCIAIESLKALLRPKPFDIKDVKKTLQQLGIDPASPNGLLLLERGRAANAVLRANFAPRPCPK